MTPAFILYISLLLVIFHVGYAVIMHDDAVIMHDDAGFYFIYKFTFSYLPCWLCGNYA